MRDVVSKQPRLSLAGRKLDIYSVYLGNVRIWYEWMIRFISRITLLHSVATYAFTFPCIVPTRFTTMMAASVRILAVGLSSALFAICNAEHCNRTMYPLPDVCVTDMAQGSYPTCASIQLPLERRICELRDTNDTRALRGVATIVGQVSWGWSLKIAFTDSYTSIEV